MLKSSLLKGASEEFATMSVIWSVYGREGIRECNAKSLHMLGQAQLCSVRKKIVKESINNFSQINTMTHFAFQ